MRRSTLTTLKGILAVIGLAIAIPLFLMLLVTITDKLAYGETREVLSKEVPTWTYEYGGVTWKLPLEISRDFDTWIHASVMTNDGSYGLLEFINPVAFSRVTFMIDMSSKELFAAAIGKMQESATHWWIWKDGKVYKVDPETAKAFINSLSRTSV